MTVEERFWAKVDKTEGGCWLWLGGTTGTTSGSAYGRFLPDGQRSGDRKPVLAHRFAYELLEGPIPEGYTLDHLADRCQSTLCVNPAHLEPVTIAENIRRARRAITHCRRAGHPLSGDNLYIIPSSGKRVCRACQRERQAVGSKENDFTPGMRWHG